MSEGVDRKYAWGQKMSRAVVAIVILFLSFSARAEPESSGNPIRDEALASCRLQALRTYPAEEGPFSRRLDHYNLICMEAMGYRFDVELGRCGFRSSDLYEDPACYGFPSQK